MRGRAIRWRVSWGCVGWGGWGLLVAGSGVDAPGARRVDAVSDRPSSHALVAAIMVVLGAGAIIGMLATSVSRMGEERGYRCGYADGSSWALRQMKITPPDWSVPGCDEIRERAK